MNRFFVFIIAFVIPLLSLHANDTSFGGAGGLPVPVKETNVKMVDEKIVLQGHELNTTNFRGKWRVICDFTFENTSNMPLAFKMGFPLPVIGEESAVSIPAGHKGDLGDPLVHDFAISVDGQSKPVKRQPIGANEEHGIYYKEAYLWDMSFLPRQTVKVHHDYVTGITGDVMGFNTVSYVLKTGGLWQGGAIGHTHLEVIPNAPSRICSEIDKSVEEYTATTPPGMKIVTDGRYRKYVWDLDDFTPKNDLNLCLLFGKPYIFHQIVVPIINQTMDLKSLSKEKLRLLRNTIFAQYGRKFKDQALQQYFNEQWWYEPNASYSDNMLSKEDKEALVIIGKAEA
jgi:hypothetical protein